VRIYGADLKKHDLLRVATANDAAEIVAEIDSVLRIAKSVCQRRHRTLPRLMTSSPVCLRTWRCQRPHETRCHYKHKLARMAGLCLQFMPAGQVRGYLRLWVAF